MPLLLTIFQKLWLFRFNSILGLPSGISQLPIFRLRRGGMMSEPAILGM